MTKKEKYYTDNNEWVEVCDGVATFGLTKEALREIGSMSYVELPKKGTYVSRDEEVVIIEASKAAIDILSPVVGEIIDINENVQKDPSLIEKDPEDSGWLLKIKCL